MASIVNELPVEPKPISSIAFPSLLVDKLTIKSWFEVAAFLIAITALSPTPWCGQIHSNSPGYQKISSC